MRTSEATIEHIKLFEGLRLQSYKPVETEKYYTIGYGHCGPDVGARQSITKDYADFLLRRDIQRADKQINALGLQLTQNHHDALADFVFNLGIANLKTSTLLKKIRTHASTDEIQREFRRWVHAGGKVLQGLVKRREWEARLWAMV